LLKSKIFPLLKEKIGNTFSPPEKPISEIPEEIEFIALKEKENSFCAAKFLYCIPDVITILMKRYKKRG
jgi:hypothetical protein